MFYTYYIHASEAQNPTIKFIDSEGAIVGEVSRENLKKSRIITDMLDDSGNETEMNISFLAPNPELVYMAPKFLDFLNGVPLGDLSIKEQVDLLNLAQFLDAEDLINILRNFSIKNGEEAVAFARELYKINLDIEVVLNNLTSEIIGLIADEMEASGMMFPSKHIKIAGAHAKDGVMINLPRILKRMPNCFSVSVEGGLSEKGLEVLGNTLKDMPNLTAVSLGKSHWNLYNITNLINKINKKLSSFSLEGVWNYNNSFEMAAFAMGLKHCPHLKSLSIQTPFEHGVTLIGADPLLAQLHEMKKLESFSIRGSFLDVSPLVRAFNQMPQLKHIDVWSTELFDDSMQRLMDTFKTMPDLTSISLMGGIQNEAIGKLAEVLKDKGNLKNLEVHGYFDDSGLEELSKALVGKDKLESVVIKGSFDKGGIEKLATVLNGLRSLKSVTILRSYVEVDDTDAVKALFSPHLHFNVSIPR